jgi:hypothetical protein
MAASQCEIWSSDQSLFAFLPNAARARLVEARVRNGLAVSLEAAIKALAAHGAPSGEELFALIRSDPVSPRVFGAYTELVEAIFADDIDGAVQIAKELCAPGFGLDTGLRIVTLENSDLGRGQAARYHRLIDDDPVLRAKLRALSPAACASVSDRVEQAIALLDVAAPELAGELRALVREIVLVERPGDRHFGASSFQIWGALFLRPCPHGGRVVIAEALVHEAAHALLFGFGMGKPLVTNKADELYTSPIRDDPRPMDGVIHATFVLARMHYAGLRLLESNLLTYEEEQVAREEQERHMHYYARGAAVIEAHARWTEVGEAALNSARAYMTPAQ